MPNEIAPAGYVPVETSIALAPGATWELPAGCFIAGPFAVWMIDGPNLLAAGPGVVLGPGTRVTAPLTDPRDGPPAPPRRPHPPVDQGDQDMPCP